MTDINHVVLVGNVVRDCGAEQNSFAYLANGTAVARISIACSRSRKTADGQRADEASFFDITIWGKTAENLKSYLTKGKKIAVQGFLKQDRWKDQQGNNRSRVSVVAENVQLLGGQQSVQSQGFSPDTVYPTAQAARQAEAGYGQPAASSSGNETGFPEDIPF